VKIIRNLNQIKNGLPPLALTIGNFDGVHLGHLEILREIKKIAKEKNLKSAVLTFQPHPLFVLKPEKPRDFLIGSFAQKLKIFAEEEIDYVIALPFSKNLAEIAARNFVRKILVEHLNAKHLAVGYDFTFGKNREGNFKLLEEKSKKFAFTLSEISVVKNGEETCSSSAIRKFISEGKIAEANKFLGRNFAVCGIVNEGRKLASQLGFPTANLKPKPHIIQPKFGVYKTETFIPHLNKKFPSITNFGIKPTVANITLPLYETHLPDFSQNLYGKKIRIEFLEFLRDEKKFASLDELKNQIASDVKRIS
jgi:riboflavin kinase/FMN adenylyltransferase